MTEGLFGFHFWMSVSVLSSLCRTGRWAISRTHQLHHGLTSMPLICTFLVWLQAIFYNNNNNIFQFMNFTLLFKNSNDLIIYSWESVQSWKCSLNASVCVCLALVPQWWVSLRMSWLQDWLWAHRTGKSQFRSDTGRIQQCGNGMLMPRLLVDRLNIKHVNIILAKIYPLSP